MKVFSIRLSKTRIVLFVAVALVTLGHTYSQTRSQATMLPLSRRVVVIDAGHGGWDPGKTGVAGEDEKSINLKIALKLQKYLEQGGAEALLTRADDSALGGKKGEDMKGRKEIANESGADIFVSIHQNAFTGGRASGAQVFYYNTSDDSRRLAECIQEALKSELDLSNQRQAKANTNYYVLKNTKVPAVIVECGFISNAEEEKKLNNDDYQEKTAWAVYMGIVKYFEEGERA